MSDTKQNIINMKNNYYMDEMAISPVIGIILMVAATIVIAGVIMAMLGGFVIPDKPPYAILSVSDAEGGLQDWTPSVTLRNNSIRILHRGGDRLCVNETMIVMQGYGQVHPSFPAIAGGGWVGENIKYPILVSYRHIHRRGKRGHEYVPCYNTRNFNLLADGYWSAGEILSLNGHDIDRVSSALRSINATRIGNANIASGSWQFKPNSRVNLLIVDIPSNQVISSITFTMRQFS